MDELDIKIIRLLQQDGRTSNAEIGRSLGVSEGTIRRRLKWLVDEEYIRIVAVLDPAKIGYLSEAIVGVQVDPDKIDQVSNQLVGLEEIDWVEPTTGSYDIFFWAILPSFEALGIFLSTKVGIIPGIRRTETFVILSVEKRSHGIAI